MDLNEKRDLIEDALLDVVEFCRAELDNPSSGNYYLGQLARYRALLIELGYEKG